MSNGGGIALGHPIAAPPEPRLRAAPWPSRLPPSLVAASAVAALCGGGGQGDALNLMVPTATPSSNDPRRGH
jgi:acetyl-CoA acetyltransferase